MIKHPLGKIYNVPIFVNLKEEDLKDIIDLTDLSSTIKKEIEEYKKENSKTKINAWFSPSEFIIDREEYFRLIRLKTSIIKNRSINNEKYLTYLAHSLNKKQLGEICKSFKIRGYSSLTKDKLVNFLVNTLSEEERGELIIAKETDIISLEFAKALAILNGKGTEKIESVNIKPDKKEVEITFKGINWDVSCFLSINENIDDPERDCDCNTGANQGFCCHFWICFLKALELKFLQLADWKLTYIPTPINNILNDLLKKKIKL